MVKNNIYSEGIPKPKHIRTTFYDYEDKNSFWDMVNNNYSKEEKIFYNTKEANNYIKEKLKDLKDYKVEIDGNLYEFENEENPDRSLRVVDNRQGFYKQKKSKETSRGMFGLGTGFI